MDTPQNIPKFSLSKDRYLVIFILASIIIISAYFRFIGVNWDQDSHLHPDERFMTIVAEKIHPVDSLSEYFDTENSTLNPLGYGFYTYGMLPLFVTRFIAELVSKTDYNQVVLVGRVLSGLFDLAAIISLYLLGKRVYQPRVGILAAALYGATVLPIQLSHFFAVDSFTTVFLLGGFYTADQVREKPRYWAFAIFGALTGLAMTTKVSIAPMAGLVVLAGMAYLTTHWDDKESRSPRLKNVFLGWILSGVLAALFFRIFQPYAFSGPGFFGLQLNPQWLDIIQTVSDQVAGRADFPPNHHWAGRPWHYGLSNMVRWGMGYPLGIVAMLSWIWAAWRCLRGDWRRHFMFVIWVGGFFLWQNSHFWRYTRYFLPVYPLIILLAAWGLFELFDRVRKISRWGRMPAILATLLLSTVVISTYAYAYAFTRIYSRPHTRVAASNWMRQNMAGPLNIVLKTQQGEFQIPLSMPYDLELVEGEPWSVTFSPDRSGVLSGITSNRIVSHQNESFKSDIEFIATLQSGGGDPLGVISHTIQYNDWKNLDEGIPFHIAFPEIVLNSDETYTITLEATNGSPIQFSGVGIALETAWDDALPIRRENFDPYGGIYRQFNLELFEPDTESKLDRIVELLGEATYLIISSDRVYDAIPNLPLRFPMTVAFYQALFGCDSVSIAECAYPATVPLEGDLGFELVATFESYPTLGRLAFPDLSAQESFTVYDHPKVFIFQKTPTFSRDHVQAVLERIDLNQVVSQTAAQVTDAPTALRIPSDRLVRQKNGGTWSEIFSQSSVLNQRPFLGVLSWYFLLFVIGWLAFPITFLAFRGLSDRGYGLSRLIGLLVVGWVVWFGSSYEIFPFTRSALWFGLGLLWILGAVIAWIKFDHFINFIKKHWKHILTIEGLFLALFLLALIFRWYNPDLWHPWRGGEKPGDLALFQAVLKTVYFPPYDPWMAGNLVNYFYFGYVLAAVPTKLLGIIPEVAYNLLIPTWFGLTGLGLFSLSYNLTATHSPDRKDSITEKMQNALPYLAGSMTLIVGLLLGNLAQIRILWEQLPSFAPNRVSDPNFIEQAGDVATGLGQILSGKAELFHGDQGIWYFDATRAIQSGETVAPITEFPFFSFLYADLHPHLLGMPLVLCGLAWLLSVLYSPPLISKQSIRKDWIVIGCVWLIGGLVVGATYPTNTWDFPAILGIGIIAIGYTSWQYSTPNLRRPFLELLLHMGILYVLAVGLFAPFRQWFSTGSLSPEFWPGPRTSLLDYLTVHGLFVFMIITFLMIETLRWVRPIIDRAIHTPLGELVPGFRTVLSVLVGILVVIIFGGGWLWRNDFQTAEIMIILGLWTGGLLLVKEVSLNRKVTLILIGAGLGLSFVAEMVAIHGDVGRMNVVFKSYLLVWLFFSIASGTIFSHTWPRIRFRKIRWIWLGALGLLLAAMSTYTLIGTLAKIDDRWPDIKSPPLTLNGLAFMRGDGEEAENGLKTVTYIEQDTPLHLANDYQAFLWIRKNIQGTPTIVEGHTSEYRWGSRYSVYTGLPTVVGWSWHLRQHNVVLPSSVVENRIADVNNFYNTIDYLEVNAFLERYDVDLVVVGELERAIYSEGGIAKFAQMAANGDLEIIYPQNGEIGIVNIYSVP